MKKWQLGKKKILGLLTAGAIVVTMAGSYAVWDQLTGTTSGTVTLRDKITVTVPASTTYSSNTAWDSIPEYKSQPINIKATGIPADTKATLALEAKVYEGDGTTTEATGFTTKINDGTSDVTKTSFATPALAETGANYTVTVIPPESADTTKTYNVVLTGTLSEDTSTP